MKFNVSEDEAFNVFLFVLISYSSVGLVLILFYICFRKKLKFLYEKWTDFSYSQSLDIESLFWFFKCIFYSNNSILTAFGLDAWIQVFTLKMYMIIAFTTLIPSVVVLIPVHYIYGNRTGADFLAIISSSTIPQGSNILWIHFVLTYFYSIFVIYWLYQGWNLVVNYKQRYFMENKCVSNSVVMYNLNESDGYEEFEQVRRSVNSAYPNSYFQIVPIKDYTAIWKLLHTHDKLLLKISPNISENDDPEPENVDLQQLDQNYQLILRESTCESFHSFPAVLVAVDVASTTNSLLNSCFHNGLCQTQSIRGMEFDNVKLSCLSVQTVKRNSGFVTSIIMTSLIIVFWTIPFAFVSSAANFIAIAVTPNLNDSHSQNIPAILSYSIQGLVPTLTMALFNLLIYYALKFATKYEYNLKKSQDDISLLDKVASFTIVNNIFVFVISGSLWHDLQTILQQPIEIPKILASSIPLQANFYLGYILQQILVSHPWEILQGMTFFRSVACKYRSKSQVSEKLDTLPYHPDFVNHLSKNYFHFGIGLFFCTISPAITIVWSVYATISYILSLRYFARVSQPHYFYGGELWITTFNWTVVYILLFQALMAGFFTLKENIMMALLIAPMFIATILLHRMMLNHFRYSFYFITIQTLETLQRLTEVDVLNLSQEFDPKKVVPATKFTPSIFRIPTTLQHLWCLEPSNHTEFDSRGMAGSTSSDYLIQD